MDFDNIEDIRAYFADDEFARKCLGATIDDYDFEDWRRDREHGNR